MTSNNEVCANDDYTTSPKKTGEIVNVAVAELSDALNAAQVEVQMYRQQLLDSRLELDKNKQKVSELNSNRIIFWLFFDSEFDEIFLFGYSRIN